MAEHDSRPSNHARPFSFHPGGAEAPSSLRDEPPPSPAATVVLRTTNRREISASGPCEARFAEGESGRLASGASEGDEVPT